MPRLFPVSDSWEVPPSSSSSWPVMPPPGCNSDPAHLTWGEARLTGMPPEQCGQSVAGGTAEGTGSFGSGAEETWGDGITVLNYFKWHRVGKGLNWFIVALEDELRGTGRKCKKDRFQSEERTFWCLETNDGRRGHPVRFKQSIVKKLQGWCRHEGLGRICPLSV